MNESVLREVHPIPKVDETLAQLTSASFISKLDGNSGFWEVPLDTESQILTTFIMPDIVSTSSRSGFLVHMSCSNDIWGKS